MHDEYVSVRMMLGFFAGFIAVLLFQQPVLALLYALGFTSRAPYSTVLTLPLGVPYVWALAFWGGVWGIVLGGIDNRFAAGPRFWRAIAIYGAIVPTALQWIMVLALRHQPLGGTWSVGNIVSPFLMNAVWGIGTEAILIAMWTVWRASDVTT